MKIPGLIFAALAALAGTASAAEKGWSVRAEWMAVSVPNDVALRLVPVIRHPRTTEKAVAEIEGMIAAGTATLHGRLIAWTRSGARSEAGQVEELRFPTEQSPPGGIPQNFGNAPILPAPPRVLPTYPGIDVPVEFEMRNVGMMLEVEPMVQADGRTIFLNLVTRHVWLKHWHRVLDKPGAAGGIFEQPQLRTFQTTTSFDAESGRWRLLGVYAGAAPEGHTEISLLRTTAIPTTR